MINDLDETIKQLLIKKGALDNATVDISFDIPDREWSASISKPRINLYLYDIRENHELRGTEWVVTKDSNGKTSRKKNASRLDLSYLITVWANDVADEHRLLWQILHTLFRFPVLPREVLAGKLAKQDYPISTVAAQPDGLFNNPADFWTALDNEIKPSINYVLTVALDLDLIFTAPATESVSIDVHPPEVESGQFVTISGRVFENGKPARGLAKAKLRALEAGIIAISDSKGNYTFPQLKEGKHTFRVFLPGKKIREYAINVPGSNYDLEY
jgi:hypothetical protein